jgi:hypothetical protein
MEAHMFSLKSDLLFSSLLEARDFAKRINARFHPVPHSDADPRELQRLRAELKAAREKVRLMSVINRNRIY